MSKTFVETSLNLACGLGQAFFWKSDGMMVIRGWLDQWQPSAFIQQGFLPFMQPAFHRPKKLYQLDYAFKGTVFKLFGTFQGLVRIEVANALPKALPKKPGQALGGEALKPRLSGVQMKAHYPSDALMEKKLGQWAMQIVGGGFKGPCYLEGTPFSLTVLQKTLAIPFGQTRSYGQIGSDMCRPFSSRAVGKALGNNALAYLIPCHRVIRTDGDLGGYRYGQQVKRDLLQGEGAKFVA